jgi:hypothetical protein
MEATEDSFQAFKGGTGRLFREEGRLVDHVFWNGRYVDVIIAAIYRHTWDELSVRLAGLLPAENRPNGVGDTGGRDE